MNPLRPDKDGHFENILDGEFGYDYFYGQVSLGNETQYTVGMFRIHSGELFIGIEGKGAYTFRGFAHVNYVMEKLGLRSESDAGAMADFINSQNFPAYDFVTQGDYSRYPELLRK